MLLSDPSLVPLSIFFGEDTAVSGTIMHHRKPIQLATNYLLHQMVFSREQMGIPSSLLMN